MENIIYAFIELIVFAAIIGIPAAIILLFIRGIVRNSQKLRELPGEQYSRNEIAEIMGLDIQ